MEKIAVTGATGFIGSHLVKELLKRNYKVIILVHENKKAPKGVKVVVGDLLTKKGLDTFLSGVDVVINLVGGYYPPFEKQFKLNVLSFANLCEAASKKKVSKIVHVSSVAAYGSQSPLPKEKQPLLPDTAYGLAKKMGEEVALYFNKTKGMSFTIIRPPNVYGPGNDDGVIFNFLNSVIEKGKVIIYGDGKKERDFLYVSDLVSAIIKSLKLKSSYEVFNVGSGERYNILGLLKILEELIGKNIKVKFRKEKSFSPKIIAADISRAKKVLEWEPEVSLKEGLKLTLEALD